MDALDSLIYVKQSPFKATLLSCSPVLHSMEHKWQKRIQRNGERVCVCEFGDEGVTLVLDWWF